MCAVGIVLRHGQKEVWAESPSPKLACESGCGFRERLSCARQSAFCTEVQSPNSFGRKVEVIENYVPHTAETFRSG